jgi:magnesium chelatase family protein
VLLNFGFNPQSAVLFARVNSQGGRMTVIAHEPAGFEGSLVHVEVDIRRGIPGVDLVGLAAGAVKEARERVRAAIRNSGFIFPLDRVLINLAPADLPKAGAAYDLPMALALLGASGAIPEPGRPILALGELRLDGTVRPVRGVLPAVAAALRAGVDRFIVPEENAAEARALRKGFAFPIARLEEATLLLGLIREGREPPPPGRHEGASTDHFPRALVGEGDLSELKGQGNLRRALEIAAAGGHNVFLFGPPGSGKTMAARRFVGVLPDLSEEDAVQVASLYSLSGVLGAGAGLQRRPSFRAPHHSASLEGMIGGGHRLRPGEISLAHKGVLFLDEAAEFHSDVLQSLREPIEEGRVSLVRAGSIARFPAEFQLVMAANPCPCGNLGRKGKACLCSIQELQRYRRKLGGPLLDRIDIRVPVEPAPPETLLGPAGESSAEVRARVEGAFRMQAERYRGEAGHRDETGQPGESRAAPHNARLEPGRVERYCRLEPQAARAFQLSVQKLSLSSRASHSILKVARTIADLAGRGEIGEEQMLEAVKYRRFGDGDEVWPGD